MQLERNGGIVVWAVTKRTVDQKARISFSSILGSFINRKVIVIRGNCHTYMKVLLRVLSEFYLDLPVGVPYWSLVIC